MRSKRHGKIIIYFGYLTPNFTLFLFILNTEQLPHSPEIKHIADNMGVSLYQRFDITEGSLFLRMPVAELKKIVQQDSIGYMELSANSIEFFGYQLVEFLLSKTHNATTSFNPNQAPDRIIRAKEVQEITGLSRTTIWRMENYGSFPKRVSLGANSVGWKLSEVNEWLKNK
jgi:predicted DNA-binding transcriptional regulator AlpA